jgi:hypothetical protein
MIHGFGLLKVLNVLFKFFFNIFVSLVWLSDWSDTSTNPWLVYFQLFHSIRKAFNWVFLFGLFSGFQFDSIEHFVIYLLTNSMCFFFFFEKCLFTSLVFFLLFLCFCAYKTRSHYIAKAGLELLILLPSQPPECSDYRHPANPFFNWTFLRYSAFWITYIFWMPIPCWMYHLQIFSSIL